MAVSVYYVGLYMGQNSDCYIKSIREYLVARGVRLLDLKILPLCISYSLPETVDVMGRSPLGILVEEMPGESQVHICDAVRDCEQRFTSENHKLNMGLLAVNSRDSVCHPLVHLENNMFVKRRFLLNNVNE